MRILFLCTAHNSLSQRLYLDLSASGHAVSIEYALSDQMMIDAAALFAPHLIICPFLTSRVPKEVYNKYMTLIVHPGPPGDAGPSAIDWLLMGDDGTIDDPNELLLSLKNNPLRPGRSHWGVTVLQAIEDLDGGPVWAFAQFPVNIDEQNLTKATLYRGPITRSAVAAVHEALARLKLASQYGKVTDNVEHDCSYSPHLRALPNYRQLSVGNNEPWKGGRLHDRPLLKAASRDFDVTKHCAAQVSRRIRCADSQPGVQSSVFGPALYLYGGMIEDNTEAREGHLLGNGSTKILGLRNEAVCIATNDGLGVWITHLRRLKGKSTSLFPKISAVSCLLELGVIDRSHITAYDWPLGPTSALAQTRTFQEVWVEFEPSSSRSNKKIAYVHFDFYNGAMSTNKCSQLVKALQYILARSAASNSIEAVVLMGGAYFSNGIALNVIEAAKDPAWESWLNINRMDDVCQLLLQDFPAHGILTVAAIRGNAAAGGVALATACDVVIAGAEVVLNPSYSAVGLSGSEYHTLSYYGRCGQENAQRILREMKPLSPLQARRMGLVDFVFPGHGEVLGEHIRSHVSFLMEPGCLRQGMWKARVCATPDALSQTRTMELGEMSQDFWGSRSAYYNSCRSAFVRKAKPTETPSRFALHRQSAEDAKDNAEAPIKPRKLSYFGRTIEQDLLSVARRLVHEEVLSASPEFDTNGAKEPNYTMPQLSQMMENDTGAVKAKQLSQTLFSCYYTPMADLPSPPETP